MDEEEHFVCDVIRGVPAPFDNPNAIAWEYTQAARSYNCHKIIGDHFAGAWVQQSFMDCGISYEVSPLPKSQLYLESLPHFNRGAVQIPNHDKLTRELRSLERRVHRSGRDSVEHPGSGSDDYANAVVGSLYLATLDLHRPRRYTGTYLPFLPAGASPDAGYIRWNADPHERPRIRIVEISEKEDLRRREKGTW